MGSHCLKIVKEGEGVKKERDRKNPEKGQKHRRGNSELICHPLDGWQMANSTRGSSHHKTSHTICPYATINKSALSYKYQALCDDKKMSNRAYGKLLQQGQENLDDIFFHQWST